MPHHYITGKESAPLLQLGRFLNAVSRTSLRNDRNLFTVLDLFTAITVIAGQWAEVIANASM